MLQKTKIIMEQFESNDEILNKSLMFKLLNRQQYIKELLQKISKMEREVNVDTRVKELNQTVGKLTAYIDELEYFKSNLNQVGLKEKLSKSKHDHDNLKDQNKQLITNNTILKQENKELKYLIHLNENFN